MCWFFIHSTRRCLAYLRYRPIDRLSAVTDHHSTPSCADDAVDACSHPSSIRALNVRSHSSRVINRSFVRNESVWRPFAHSVHSSPTRFDSIRFDSIRLIDRPHISSPHRIDSSTVHDTTRHDTTPYERLTRDTQHIGQYSSHHSERACDVCAWSISWCRSHPLSLSLL